MDKYLPINMVSYLCHYHSDIIDVIDKPPEEGATIFRMDLCDFWTRSSKVKHMKVVVFDAQEYCMICLCFRMSKT